MRHIRARLTALPPSGRLAAVIAALFLALGLAYGLATPLFEATDEIRHFRYVRYLQVNHALPPLTAEASKELQAHHPPLYYTIVALASAGVESDLGPDYSPPGNPYWGFRYFEVSTDNKTQYHHTPAEQFPGQGGYRTLWIGRLVSLLFGLGVVLLTRQLGDELYPGRPAVGLVAMAFVAFNPMFLHGSMSLNNDVPVAFFGIATIWLAAKIDRSGATPKAGLLLGLALGLGTLTKANMLALGLPAGLAMLVALYRQRDSQTWGALGLSGLAVLLTTGPWLLRNWQLTGDLLGSGEYAAAWVGEADRLRLVIEAWLNLPYTWSTFWARFAYGQIPASNTFYWLYAALLLGALGGLLWRRPRLDWLSLLALLLVLGSWAFLVISIPATNNARLIFPVYPVLGVLVALGLTTENTSLRTALTWSAGLLALALVALLGYLRPAFAYPAAATEDQIPPATRQYTQLGDVAEILGYRADVHDDILRPGSQIDLTIWWRPLRQTADPWSVFVHLIDEDNIMATQRDTWPGLSTAPTTTWRPGQLFADTYRLFVPDSAYAPVEAALSVGLWNPATGERLPVYDQHGNLAGDVVALGELKLAAIPGEAPNSLSVNFDNQIELIGYEFDQRQLYPGDTFQLTTYWWAEQPLITYAIFAELTGPDGRIWARQDSMMLPPTNEWPLREVRLEIRELQLAPDTPPGEYTLIVGLRSMDESDPRRIPILHADGRWQGDTLELGRLRVEARP